MKRIIFLVALLATVPLKAQDVQLDVTFSQSSSGGNTTWTITVPDDDAALIKDAYAAWAGWTATVECDDARIAAGDCLEGQRGEQIPNPETYNAAVKRAFRELLRQLTDSHQQRLWREAAGNPPNVTAIDN